MQMQHTTKSRSSAECTPILLTSNSPTHIYSQNPSNLPRHLALHPGPLSLPLVPQRRVHQIRLEDQQRQVPHQRDGVEEVGVAAAGVQPQVVERRA